MLLYALLVFSCNTRQVNDNSAAINKALTDTIAIENLYVTSQMNTEKHQPEQMFDKKMQTAWMSTSGTSVDEGIKITFDKAYPIGGIIIYSSEISTCTPIESLNIYTNNSKSYRLVLPGDTIFLNKKISRLYLQVNKLNCQKKIRANSNKYQNATYLLKTNTEKSIGISEIVLLNKDRVKYYINSQNIKCKSSANHIALKPENDQLDKKITNVIETENTTTRYSITIKSDYTINQSITNYEQNRLQHRLLGGFWEILNESNNKITLSITNRVLWDTENNDAEQKPKDELVKDTIIIDNNKIIMDKYTLFSEPEPESLVDLSQIGDDFVFDLRYATKNNFVGEILYDTCRCLLRYEVVKDVIKANSEFKQQGYRIKFFDCYRPLHVQQKMWDKVPVTGFVANPARGGSVHNRGGAVDITLVDSTGKELDMGTDFDFFGLKANHTYQNLEPHVLKNRNLLKTVMERHNFRAIRSEWWHYSHTKAWHFPVSDQPLGSF